MRVVLQRVTEAAVNVGGRTVGSIGKGILLLVGFRNGDGEEEVEWMARKIVELRVFDDEQGRMNRSLEEVDGGILVVSQFTLYGDTRKGRRPSFVRAAPPEVAVPLYERLVALLRERAPGPVADGEFGAMMEVSLVNDGPVTLILDREPAEDERGPADGERGSAGDEREPAGDERGPPGDDRQPSEGDRRPPGVERSGEGKG